MGLGGCCCLVKYFLILINIVFWVSLFSFFYFFSLFLCLSLARSLSRSHSVPLHSIYRFIEEKTLFFIDKNRYFSTQNSLSFIQMVNFFINILMHFHIESFNSIQITLNEWMKNVVCVLCAAVSLTENVMLLVWCRPTRLIFIHVFHIFLLRKTSELKQMKIREARSNVRDDS